MDAENIRAKVKKVFWIYFRKMKARFRIVIALIISLVVKWDYCREM